MHLFICCRLDLSEWPELLLVRRDANSLSVVRGGLQRGRRGSATWRSVHVVERQQWRPAGGRLSVSPRRQRRQKCLVGFVRLQNVAGAATIHDQHSSLFRRTTEVRRTAVRQPSLRLSGQWTAQFTLYTRSLDPRACSFCKGRLLWSIKRMTIDQWPLFQGISLCEWHWTKFRFFCF